MPNLFPVFDVPTVLVEDTLIQAQFPVTPLFDIESGEFIVNGAHRTVLGSGYDAWILWCTKTILTQRWGYLGYSGNAGIEIEEAFSLNERKAIQSAFELTITEALLADPLCRTRMVRDFVFQWPGQVLNARQSSVSSTQQNIALDADSLYITCTVIGTDGSSATIKSRLNAN